jgi:hypothetical protein
MTVVLEISMSLDGYVTAAGVRPEEPMGDGGQQLHQWAFGADERGREVLAESVRKVGASVAGRRTYDLVTSGSCRSSAAWWSPTGTPAPSATAGSTSPVARRAWLTSSATLKTRPSAGRTRSGLARRSGRCAA